MSEKTLDKKCPYCGKVIVKDEPKVRESDGYYHLWCAIRAGESPADYGYEGDAC